MIYVEHKLSGIYANTILCSILNDIELKISIKGHIFILNVFDIVLYGALIFLLALIRIHHLVKLFNVCFFAVLINLKGRI